MPSAVLSDGVSSVVINLHTVRLFQMEMDNLKDMVSGKPDPLVSSFRLTYYSILNLLSRTEGQFTAEHVIKNSFHQFQYEKVHTEKNTLFYVTTLY